MTHRLRYNETGQTLSHVSQPRQATVTWALEDLRYTDSSASRTLDSGTAVVDSATEVTTAAAGPGQANPRLLSVASTTGFSVGTTYEVVSTTGESELVRLAGLVTDTSLIVEHPLMAAYPLGSTVRGVTHTTAAILASVLQDETRMRSDYPMRVVWTYASGVHRQEQVRLVRDDNADAMVDKVIEDCRDVFPDLDTRQAYHGRNVMAPHVRAVIRQFRADALEKGIDVERWLTGEQGHWAVVWRTLHHLAKIGNVPANVEPSVFADYAGSEYQKRWNGLTVGEASKEVLEIEPVTGTASGSDSTVYRAVIMEL